MRPALLSAVAAVCYADSVTTPLMFILGDADLRTPPTQGGEAMFRALKYLLGKPSTLYDGSK
jgi:dipeptidyl aminopeptidase/acylaminoacyl peptidase